MATLYNVAMKNEKKTILISSSLGIVSLVVGACAFLPFMQGRAREGANTEWMKDISDTTLLKDLSIPGSHDTLALYSIGDLAGKCQDLKLTSQLNAGVRFLDIRLKNDNGTLRGCHGFIDQRITFEKVEKQLEKFLDNHPSETILVSIKKEDGSLDGFEDALKEVIDPSHWILDHLPLTLGSARGKAILFSRYADSTIGVPCENGWVDGGNEESKTIFTLPNGILVQDHYCLNNVEDKISEIKETLELSPLSTSLTFNFFSGYLRSYFPPSYAVSVAKPINEKIGEIVENRSKTGVCIMDFVTTDLASKIVGCNQ